MMGDRDVKYSEAKETENGKDKRKKRKGKKRDRGRNVKIYKRQMATANGKRQTRGRDNAGEIITNYTKGPTLTN